MRDLYNLEDAFHPGKDYRNVYRARLDANLAVFDRLDGKTDWPLDANGTHPLTELLLADHLVVDLSKPYAEDSFLEIERAVLAGRTPNTENLGLEDAGVQLDARGGIIVDRYYRTTADGIYAAGDVIGSGLASTAMQQARAAACHACGLVFGVAVDQAPSSAVYGLPEIAGVGQTEEQVRAAGIPYVVGRCDLALTPRGAIAGHGGLLKLIFRADDRKLLGIHCLGDIASEVVGPGHVVLHVGGTVEMFLTLALNTPTYTYAYHDAAVDGLTRLASALGGTPWSARAALHARVRP